MSTEDIKDFIAIWLRCLLLGLGLFGMTAIIVGYLIFSLALITSGHYLWAALVFFGFPTTVYAIMEYMDA